ncbi:hypothetical protein ACWT_2642 [Actinoplanes sp. SE50]|nr:hypothetical protein ACPL_2904 [Actinoplanes sp. SE50/110]ATO82057.1 hypothetical protein ACWT_2642 [Actinoplanes sp. SE50]SLL99465.1 hypothetical protein ACSP50_2696 [Actinoplanes sp. SE50/110]
MLVLGSTAGCSHSDAVWVQGRAHPAASAPPPADNQDRFVAAVRQELPELAVDRRDEEIADLGSTACASAHGQEHDDLAAYGVSPEQARKLTDVARAALCP